MLNNKIKYFNKLHSQFRVKAPKHKWNKDIQQKLMLDFSFYSNKIEGLQLNYGDTVKYLNTGLIHTTESLQKLEELKNHHHLLETIFQTFEQSNFTEESVKSLNKGLLSSELAKEIDVLKMPGEYRDEEAFGLRKNAEMKTYCNPIHIAKEMKLLFQIFNEGIKNENYDNIENHPISNLAFFHNQFLNKVHPFADGNGRTCRLFMNIFILQRNYPLLIIKEKEDYIETIIKCEQENSDKPITELFIDLLKERMEEILTN